VLIVPIPTYEFFLHGVKPIYQPFFESLADPVRGVSVADVSHPLVALPHATRQRLTFRTGGHFSPFAHELVAGHLADFIRERQLLSRTRGTAAPAGTSDAGATPAAASTAGTPTGPGAAGSAGAPTGSAAASTAGAGNGSALSATPLATDARVRAASAASPRAAVHVLGISCFYHNSAAALIRDGEIVAAAEEERFTRVKNDRRFPHLAINYCLEEGGIDPRDLAAVVYYDSAALTFERILHTQYAVGERAREMWTRMLPSWLRYKLHVPRLIRDYLHYEGLVLQDQHHRSHAASAFYPSPFARAAILTIDGVGEWATASLGRGEDGTVELLKEMHFPHSLGLLYSAFTQFTGFKVNSGEYKMMGLAPYGQPRYVREIRDHLVDVKDDGSVELALEYFGFLESFSTTNDRFAALFGGPARQPDARITRREMDIARSIQVVTEEVMLRMARTAHRLTGESKLCLAGGVALNCVANGRLLREGPFDDLWIQPAAGDSGAALGAALDVYHTYFGGPRRPPPAGRPRQGGSYWGPEFSDDEIEAYLETHGYPYRRLDGAARADYLAQCLIDGKVVGHFAGRLEYGPRALGARSILGDARQPGMQAELNLRIKFRESFRPFAPSVLAEDAAEYFDLDRESPYMLLVAPVKEARRTPPPPMPEDQEDMLPIVRQLRSDIPAVTHVDYSARIQTVYRDDHPVYHELIRRFKEKTGCAVIVNTSFNVRGEPIICTPADAYRCFMRTGMNVLALGPFILAKEEQPPWPEGTAEGLESEDATRIEANPHPEKMLAELEEAFRTQCLPVAAALAERGALRVVLAAPRRASAWVDHRAPDSVKGLFEFPPALLETEPDARRFADAIVDLWAPGEAAERSRPLVARLVEIGLRYPPAEDLEEAVSESVYVMF
jgi:carbamoyltransferase